MQLAPGSEGTPTPTQLLQPPKPWTDLQGSAGGGRSAPLTEGRLPPFRVQTEFLLSCDSTQKHSVRIRTHDLLMGLEASGQHDAAETLTGRGGKASLGSRRVASAHRGARPPHHAWLWRRSVLAPPAMFPLRSAGPRTPKLAAEPPGFQDKLLKQEKRTTEKKVVAEYFHIPHTLPS